MHFFDYSKDDFMAINVLVRDVMSKNVKVVREDTNLHEVIATLISFEINSLIVVQGERLWNRNYKRRISQKL